MKTQQLLRNIASNYGRMLTGIVSGIYLTPFVLHRLGPEMFGMWALTCSLGGFFGLADLGLVAASARYISHFHALGDKENLQKTVSSLFALYLVLAVGCLAIGLIVAHLAPVLFHVSAATAPSFSALVVNMAWVVAIGLLCVTPLQCVLGTQRMDVMNLALFIGQLGQIILTMVGLSFGQGALYLSRLQVGIGLYTICASIFLMRKMMPDIKLRPKLDKESIRHVGSFAAFAFVLQVCSRFIYDADNVVVGMFISVSAVTAYSLVSKVIQVVRGFLGNGVTVLGYCASAESATDNRAAINTMWSEGTKWFLTLCLPMCALSMALPHDILKAWTGGEFGEAPTALAVLSMAQVLESSQQVSFQVLVNSGHHRILAIIAMIEAATNLVLSIVLAKMIGIVGVAVGTLIPSVIRNLFVYPWLMRKSFDITFQQMLKNCLVPALYATTPTLILIAIYKACAVQSDRVSLAALAASCALGSAVVAYFSCFTAERRTHLTTSALSLTKRGVRKLVVLARFSSY